MLVVSLLLDIIMTEHCCIIIICAIAGIQESLTQELTSVECSYSNGRSCIYRGSVLTHVLNLHTCILIKNHFKHSYGAPPTSAGEPLVSILLS